MYLLVLFYFLHQHFMKSDLGVFYEVFALSISYGIPPTHHT